MTPKQREQCEAFERIKYRHALQEEAVKKVQRAIARCRTKGGVVVLTGPTGIGKSHVKELIDLGMVEAFIAAGRPAGRLPFLSVTAMPPINNTYRFLSLFREILVQADEVLRERGTPLHLHTSDAIMQEAMNVLRHRQPGVFCIDEAQHITYAVAEQRLAQHLDLVKWIASESTRAVLLVGTYELLRFARVSGQLGRRVAHIAYRPYDWARDEHRREFKKVLTFFLKQLPVRIAATSGSTEDLRLFFAGSLGSIGLLKEWLERALAECLEDGRARITRDDLIATRMPKGKLLKITEEYEQGEVELRLMNEDKHGDIERRLGMTVTAPVTAQKKESRRPRLLPGTRKPVRDPVDAATAA